MKSVILIALALLVLTACRQTAGDSADSSEILVAAAANLTEAFDALAKQFTNESGIRVSFNFGSTAEMAKQLENGAPFDVFAAADVEHVDALDRAGLITPGTKALYARGRLVVWVPPESKINLTRIEAINREEIGRIAIAKPDVAPYGRAAVESLQALNLWSELEPKVIYGQNVSQAKQYVATGNAEVGFIPLALIKPGEGKYIEIDEPLHRTIDQALAVVKASHKQEAARRFTSFVLSAEGQALLAKYGYAKPSTQ